MDKIIKRKSLLTTLACSSATLHRKIAAGQFPPPLRLGSNSVGWLESTVVSYLDALQTAVPVSPVPPTVRRGRKPGSGRKSTASQTA